jgi:hypothetical protein
MRRPLALLLALGLLSPLAGCRSCELVEAELRSLEKDFRGLKDELLRSESQNEALQRELNAARQTTAGKPPAEQPPPPTPPLKNINLGRGTGGYDLDNVPGDEGLIVVVEPRDFDGHAVKTPGVLHVEALEISPEGLKTPLSCWELTPDQLRRTWKTGLMSNGYQVTLPWKSWPSTERVRVVARFTLADGHAYEAEKDVTVRPTPVAKRKTFPGTGSEAPSAAGEILLPAPRKAEADVGPRSQAPAPQENVVETAALWQPARKPASLAESVELLRPIPLPPGPGETPP